MDRLLKQRVQPLKRTKQHICTKTTCHRRIAFIVFHKRVAIRLESSERERGFSRMQCIGWFTYNNGRNHAGTIHAAHNNTKKHRTPGSRAAQSRRALNKNPKQITAQHPITTQNYKPNTPNSHNAPHRRAHLPCCLSRVCRIPSGHTALRHRKKPRGRKEALPLAAAPTPSQPQTDR